MQRSREQIGRKLMFIGCLLFWVLVVHFLTGCSVEKEQQDKVRDLEFTIAADQELPGELAQIISEKMVAPFKMTYSNDQSLYIVVGYGEQPTGGYSIAVKDLYLTENSIVIDTELIGPGKDDDPGMEKSYPFIVVKTEYLENPVVFQ